MRKLLLFFAALFCGSAAIAQIQIGSAEIPRLNRAGDLDEDDLEAFRATTTVFYIQARDRPRRADFERALRDVWTITPFIVATPDEMADYEDGRKYSSAGFGGFVVQQQGRMTGSTSLHLSYDINIARFNRRGEVKGERLLARFLIEADAATQSKFLNPVTFYSETRQGKALRALYYDAEIYNWGPGFLRTYARIINDALLAKDKRGIFTGVSDDKALRALKRDTLFMPPRLRAGSAKNRADEEGDEREADLAEAYGHPIAFIADDVLQQRILDGVLPTYYLQYVRSSSDKHVAVFDGRAGRIIYADYTPISFGFKSKDLKKIARAIDD